MNRFNKKKLIETIEVFKAETHFPNLSAPVEIDNIIQTLSDHNKIINLGPLELNEYALILSSYALFLTNQENRIKTFYLWCERNIEYIVGRELRNSEEYGFHAKNLEIRSLNETADKLNLAKNDCEYKLEYIKNISRKIEFIAERCENLSYAKRKVVD